LMIHNAWTRVIGDHEELRRLADNLERIRDQLVTIYAGRTKNTREQITKWMDAETWFTANEAKANGFAGVLVPAKKIAALVDISMFANAPVPPDPNTAAAARMLHTFDAMRDIR